MQKGVLIVVSPLKAMCLATSSVEVCIRVHRPAYASGSGENEGISQKLGAWPLTTMRLLCFYVVLDIGNEKYWALRDSERPPVIAL